MYLPNLFSRIRYVAIFVFLLFPLVASAQVFKTESGHIEFKSTVPLHSFKGTSEHLVGQISLPDSTIDFYVDVHTLDTGIGKRDHDMLETLEADKYPFAEFYGKLVSDFNPQSTAEQEVIAKGEFTIHDVSRQVSVKGTLQKSDKGLHVKASWVLNMTDYDIKPPGILFYRVSEKIHITLNAILPPK